LTILVPYMTTSKNTLFQFDILDKEANARAGLFHTPHGDIPTPVFAPVGTQATVKSITPLQLEEIGASLVLSNTYHLYLRPGSETVDKMGGLHRFMNWHNPILTDSGGFQVFSLSKTRKVSDEGVVFKSHIDGSEHQITPETSIQIQEELGADIIMAFDECAPADNRAYIEIAMHRTHTWARRCQEVKQRNDQALFGIVQGGIFEDLRTKSAEFISSLDFPGNAIGGLSVGESKDDMHQMIKAVNKVLPENKPRYLMGVGSPQDLILAIKEGIDIFDCVLPTRLARHNAALTRDGHKLNLMNAQYAMEDCPIVSDCTCYTCQNFSRAYIRHLIVAKEMLASTLLSIHNIHTLVTLMNNARQAIMAGNFQQFSEEILGDSPS